ncbi:MAG TPA: ATP-binding protein [Longimicrobiales bacterium]|nr:ATP-binding protein [Longimicrobiales bacterium]
MTPDQTVLGRPSKSFFVDVITRDLTVEEALCDLLDNSLDEAVERQRVNVMTVLASGRPRRFVDAQVRVTLREQEIRIEDNCGGISVNQARTSVFRFGNPNAPSVKGGLSVYGIGMKRAFFKLGRYVVVESSTDTEHFRVEIDVNEWKERGDEDWDFAFAEVGHHRKEPKWKGTRITISRLGPTVIGRLSSVSFVKDLLARISSSYALFLEAGMAISVNDEPAVSVLPVMLAANEMTPARRRFAVGDVDVLIMAGVSPRSDKRRHGWYVFCNGRMVLDADQTEVTGWGLGLPKWHTKFGHFVGMVYFRSEDVRNLPWRTTKQGVVVESHLYQAALAEMQVQARPVLDFLTGLYPGEVTEDGPAEREVMTRAAPVSLKHVARRESSFKVDLEQQRQTALDRTVTIQYSRKVKDIERLKACVPALRRAAAKRVGEYAFDYLLKQECGDR